MPATVRAVLVEAGQTVARGETVVILEAMKMELPVRAPHDGVVKTIACQPGELVQPGTPLLEMQ
jgi:3-methylcrotonyl-CoA carboxylase alpha subunit